MMKRVSTIAGAFALAIAAQTASAADIPTKAPAYMAPVAAPMFNWTGFYVGTQAGYGWGKTQHIDSGNPMEKFGIDGWFGGATVGFNWQSNSPWVLGVEADFSWSDIKGAETVSFIGGIGTCDCVTDLKWFGTARVRAGHAIGNSLPYLTGGIAYGKVSLDFDGADPTDTARKLGWTAGAGWEYAVAPNWSAKIEYLYVDLGKFTYQAGDPDDQATARFHLVRAGLNYRFATGGKAPGPVVTRY